MSIQLELKIKSSIHFSVWGRISGMLAPPHRKTGCFTPPREKQALPRPAPPRRNRQNLSATCNLQIKFPLRQEQSLDSESKVWYDQCLDSTSLPYNPNPTQHAQWQWVLHCCRHVSSCSVTAHITKITHCHCYLLALLFDIISRGWVWVGGDYDSLIHSTIRTLH